MNGRLKDVLDEIAGLFVDDGSLAAFAIALILIVAGAVKVMNIPPIWGGLALLAGCAAILIESLMRATRSGKKQ